MLSSCFLSENEHDCFVSTNFGFCADARFSGKQRIATCARVLLALSVHITSAHPRRPSIDMPLTRDDGRDPALTANV